MRKPRPKFRSKQRNLLKRSCPVIGQAADRVAAKRLPRNPPRNDPRKVGDVVEIERIAARETNPRPVPKRRQSESIGNPKQQPMKTNRPTTKASRAVRDVDVGEADAVFASE